MSVVRNNWTVAEVQALYDLPFNELIYQAQTIHRTYFDPTEIQLSTLLSIKTGACPEDCGYCSQSGHHKKVELKRESLLNVDDVLIKAKAAKENGASRFCMGAAWRNPSEKDFPKVIEMIKGVKALGMETCVTLGMLSTKQAEALKAAGLDYYNHNLDTSREYYSKVTSTRTYDDRLNTLEAVRQSGINVCCGGIIGMGETIADRLGLLRELANLPAHPESVPINQLSPVKNTPLGDSPPVQPLDFVRLIAIARIMMPRSVVRLSAGRSNMSDEMQVLCFFAGANSIFVDNVLLTADNPTLEKDSALLCSIGMKPGMPQPQPLE